MKKHSSITRNLVNSILLVFALFLFVIFLAVDLLLDNWIDEQFDGDLLNKASYLQSLIQAEKQTGTLRSNHLLVDELTDKAHPDDSYFQLWDQELKTIQRSPSLRAFPDFELVRLEQPLNSINLVNVTLPNGQTGRAVMSYFLVSDTQNEIDSIPVYFTLYQSDSRLESVAWIVDILLLLSFLAAIFILRTLARRIVVKGLLPLDEMNQQIKSLDLARQNQTNEMMRIEPFSQEIIEIEPIRNELNNFIQDNQLLIEKEQRLTGDIAHELKTPIAEIISLSEVSMSFPDDERLSASYKQDMLNIALRMKKIVDNLLLLQRASSSQLSLQWEDIELQDILLETQNSLAFKYPNLAQRLIVQGNGLNVSIICDHFCLHTILTNILDNAFYYGDQSPIIIEANKHKEEGLTLTISNGVSQVIEPQQLQQMLEPLFQADSARTDQQRHGLGLSIVHKLCRQTNIQLSLECNQSANRLEVHLDNIRLTPQTA